MNTYDVFQPNDGSIERLIDESYSLPSFTLTPSDFDENLQLRFGVSKTIARPTFRELSPTLFVDVDADRVVAGSLYLENSEIDNIDLRLEYYWGFNQFATLGFIKDIEKPIEEVVNESGDLVITSFQNVPAAELRGFEIEYEKEVFDSLLPNLNWAKTKEFLIKMNFTQTESEVVYAADDVYIQFTRRPCSCI